MKPEYIRTDKNGTKIYHDWTCTRCGGAGASDRWIFTGRTCYECGGSGRGHKPAIIKEYTPEYEAKLKSSREARAAKRRAENQTQAPTKEKQDAMVEETRRYNLEYNGFRRDGIGYIHAGNTYKNREAIRAAGGRWSNEINAFVAPVPVEGLKGVCITEVKACDLCDGFGMIDSDKVIAMRMRDEI